jgi:hypothetical protein
MNPSAISVFVFGIYLAFVGAGFLFIPNAVLPIFKLPKTNEPWIRVMAILIAIIAYYYIVAAQNDLTPIFWATVYARFAVLVSFIILVLTKKASPPLVLFGVIDASGAVWTLLTLLKA